ncbi:hypothetical protein WG68_06670 [Arsukibacterium ikkense]|uniref:DUF6436 domain-containing protein n=1 Tax=Arsukibacterium ikkense TaxID=336831 RepID=A0A0M2V8Q4_9GAMM|nr:DUF6436 domain-containing protein [Arsukibacterium ikkense]KKO46040.1 hypothetical protein WG68_06670 [Arsukibacterium ikkense]
MARQAELKTILLGVVFGIWLMLSSIGLYYFGNQHYGQFAGETNWQLPPAAAFNLSALGILPKTGIQVIHAQQDNCICNNRAKQHIALFTTDYGVPAQAQLHVKPAQLMQAGFALPASPAVLIFDSGQLIYAGPYATGPLCSVADSIMAPVLLQKVQLPGLWLNGEAKACRCLIKPE